MGTKMNRTEQIKVNVTEDEKEKIREIAKKQGLGLSAYGRNKMLKPIEVKH